MLMGLGVISGCPPLSFIKLAILTTARFFVRSKIRKVQEQSPYLYRIAFRQER